MKKKLVISVFAAGILMMTGCGSSDDGVTGNNDGDTISLGTPTQIITEAEATKAIAAASTLNPSANNSNKSAQRAAAFIQKTSAQKAPSSSACIGGGTYEYNFDSTYENGTTTYNNCTEDGDTLNGTLTTTNGIQTGTLTLTDNGGTALTLVYSASNGMEYRSWTGKFIDPNNTSKFIVKNYKTGLTSGVEGDYYQTDCTVDSNGQETCGQEYYVPITSTYDTSIDGGFTMELTDPQYSCMNGTYNYTTVQNLHHLNGSSSIESGELKINGVKIIFNSDNTATVTYADGSTTVITQNVNYTCN